MHNLRGLLSSLHAIHATTPRPSATPSVDLSTSNEHMSAYLTRRISQYLISAHGYLIDAANGYTLLACQPPRIVVPDATWRKTPAESKSSLLPMDVTKDHLQKFLCFDRHIPQPWLLRAYSHDTADAIPHQSRCFVQVFIAS